MMKKIQTAGLVVIRNRKLLLAFSRNKQAWYLPGGKVDPGESSVAALQREIWEELGVRLNPEGVNFYCHITAPAYGENDKSIMEQDCYLYTMDEEIRPRSEIEAVAYFSRDQYAQEQQQVIGVVDLFHRLETDGLL